MQRIVVQMLDDVRCEYEVEALGRERQASGRRCGEFDLSILAEIRGCLLEDVRGNVDPNGRLLKSHPGGKEAKR
jgi:hypothetical protein